MPWLTRASPWTPWYQHAPYGKYEIREKIPHIKHHTNNWGGNQMEWDMGETYTTNNVNMNERNAGFFIPMLRHGPFKGSFGTAVISGVTTPVFRSSEPHFSPCNVPIALFIDNFLYCVKDTITPTDRFFQAAPTTPTFPSSLTCCTDPITFYYQRSGDNTADTLTWRVDTDYAGHYHIFKAAYRDSSGYLKYFSKEYQPTSVTLTYRFGHKKTFNCFWRYSLNNLVDSGFLWLDEGLDSAGELHTKTEAYSYTVNESYVTPIPPVAFDGNDTTGGYVYHTYTMEFLPHELRHLVDGNVVRRFPDRLTPRNNPTYDVISNAPRNALTFQPAEFGIHWNKIDSLGTDTSHNSNGDPSYSYVERQYFESHLSNPGMYAVEVNGQWYPAAHHMIDYVKIYDVPKDVKIPNFPQ